MIKAITFDLDGVYFINGKANFIASLVKLGVSEEESERVFLKSDQMNKLYKQGKMTDDEFWSWATKEWNLNLSVPEIIKLLIGGYEIDENVKKTVKKARNNGYKTLVCTNNFPARINGLQKRFSFFGDFDVIILSYEVGATKPAKEIFQKLIRRSGVLAGEIVFADDNQNNLKQAEELGIQTLLYSGFDNFIRDIRGLGVKI